MIKLEKTSITNMENAIRGARNPMNSWDRGDSYCTISHEDGLEYEDCLPKFVMGENDLALARRLVKAGSDHRKFLRQIFVSVDITAPLYWWKEFDTYKVGTTANSCSTMHKIQAKEFVEEDFSFEHLGFLPYGEGEYNFKASIYETIADLNIARELFLETKDKRYWWQMIQLLPSSYNQLRTVTLTYETLINQYHARKHHKLDEWHIYCDWIETLPYFKEMCLEGETDGE